MTYQPQLFGEGRFERWLKFHRENPRVYELFRGFAMQAFNAGRKRMGARAIFERIRWYVNIDTRTQEEFKVNNDFFPYFARLLMLEEPTMRGFFERRDGRFDTDDETILREAATCGR